MIAVGFPRQAVFVAAGASAFNDQVVGGSPGTWSEYSLRARQTPTRSPNQRARRLEPK
jgi:hypothetical protein